MRYFRDLLEEGYQHAIFPEENPDTLRSRRLALGIPFPELDLVPLWSRRGSDGRVSIPFIDFIITHFLGSLERTRREVREAHRPHAMLWGNPTSSGTCQEWGADDTTPASLPILEDHFLPEATLARLCGPEGVLSQILRRCDNSIRGGSSGSVRVGYTRDRKFGQL